MVEKLLAANSVVFALDKTDEGLETLLANYPNSLRVRTIDLLDWEKTREVVHDLGPVDCLINCAGLVIPESFLETTLESINLYVQI